LEEELARRRKPAHRDDRRERAILVSISTGSKLDAEESLVELKQLADSSGLVALDAVCQLRRELDPKYLIGRGKMQELIIRALQLGADMIVFDRNLQPGQLRAIQKATDLKVIDRTQLILDIFAQRALSREGKLQVELAQLRYLLPRLTEADTGLSRLTGGIGARGPGETKLEVDRRRVRARIDHLESQIDQFRKQREQRRAQRRRHQLPVVSIVGYTNAGKSTLLNTLTRAGVLAEARMFATLDPTSRRLRLPRERDVIISDTVGFIRDLPPDLKAAFRATLEEIADSDLIVHLVDASHPQMDDHIAAVTEALSDLQLDRIPVVLVLNKQDLIEADLRPVLCRKYDAISVSAEDPSTVGALLNRIERLLPAKAQTNEAHHLELTG
ncbi:MAG: GTPase HflX, partial [Acidobacteria bacterium]|nr:GTPase HflX [Acidobacteriota bacterium]